MPAARKPGGGGRVAELHEQARVMAVVQSVKISRYYVSLDLLLAQIAQYRAAHNEEQLYVFMLRYASMVIETLKKHKDFNASAPQYVAAQKRAAAFLAECEELKLQLQQRDIQEPQAHTSSRPAESVRIETSTALPDINWDAAPTAGAAAGAAAGAGAASAPPLPPGALQLSTDLEWIPRPSNGQQQQGQGPLSAAAPLDSWQQQQAPGSAGSSSGVGSSSSWPEPVSYSSHYTASNAQLKQKHSLFVHRADSSGSSSGNWPPQQQQLQQSSSGRARYPSFNASPIDAVWAPAGGSSSGPNSSSSGGGAPGVPNIGSLSLHEQQQLLQQQQPSAGPSLGPQQVEVQSMGSCMGHPGGTCAAPPPPLSPQQQQQQLMQPSREGAAEAAAAAAAGPKAISKRRDLRDVHISVALMNDFLHFASYNTRRGVEFCGILAGRLSASDSRLTVTTLIVPKQTGTSDTVEMLNEEEQIDVMLSRELMPLGWIHTHPTQTCFLSSVDIHTQCGFQTMLEEAVAIVMAPTDSRKKCGIFRLTTPDGLSHVQRCTYRGFHHQCSSSQYELCGHVYLNPNAKHEVVDLRS